MRVYFSVLLNVLFVLGASSTLANGPVDLRAQVNISTCLLNHFTGYLDENTDGKTREFHLGTLYRINELFEKAGVDTSRAGGLNFFVQNVIRPDSSDPLLLQYVEKALNRTLHDSSQLLVCVPGGECHFNGNTLASHFHLEGNFNPASFDHPPSPEAMQMKLRSFPFKRVEPSVLTIKNGPDHEMIEAVFHESCHFADVDLVNDWMNANVRLLRASQPPDPLFSKYVRWNATRTGLEVDEDFITFFLESRAYLVQFQITSKILKMNPEGAQMIHALEMERRQDTLERLQGPYSVSERIFTDFSVTATNLFEHAVEIGTQMEQTILRSKK